MISLMNALASLLIFAVNTHQKLREFLNVISVTFIYLYIDLFSQLKASK
ncbi:hypothetical protein [Vibrio coralliilyticus]|nr:hypothetical protein [Vibrio coralliilyticus]